MTTRAVHPGDYDTPHPIYAVWEITLRCDQACKTCGSRAGLARRTELTRDQALDAARQLAEAGLREVTLIGGEAYLRDDWLDIIAALTSRAVAVSLVSGGRQLTAERARQAAAVGVRSVSISVDGLAATHDGLRAVPGSFQRAMQALHHVADAGMVATVNSQINQRNRHEFEELGEVIAGHGARAWQLQLTTPMGRAADQVALILQPYDLLEVVPRLAALSEALAPRVRVMASNNLGYFGPHESRLRVGSPWQGCPAGQWSVGLQSDGRVKPCSSLPTEPYADVPLAVQPLATTLQGGTSRALRERTVDDLWGYCRECYYAEICLGGCPWTAHTLLGRPGNQPWCHHRALELSARGVRERLVPVEAPHGDPFDYGRWDVVTEPIPT